MSQESIRPLGLFLFDSIYNNFNILYLNIIFIFIILNKACYFKYIKNTNILFKKVAPVAFGRMRKKNITLLLVLFRY